MLASSRHSLVWVMPVPQQCAASEFEADVTSNIDMTAYQEVWVV